MLQFRKNVLFKTLTTFKIGGPAREFVEIVDPNDLPEALDYAKTHELEVLILGGGSNMLVSDRGFNGLVIQIGNKGLRFTEAGQNESYLTVGSGEVWDDVVKFAVDNGLWGIENLSRIPGRTGAFTVQNVGAYGPEAKDVVVSVDAYDRKNKAFVTLSKEECEFTYRKSVFNTTKKNRYIILSTKLLLSTTPKRMLGYPDVKRRFENTPEPTQQEIRNAIKSIRDSKFPFPAESVEGNAGSFFKNSVLTADEYRNLEDNFSRTLPEHLEKLQQIRHKFPTEEGIKIPTAFIFDALGLKGYELGKVKLNPAQPVVILNTMGDAEANDVLALVREVRDHVRTRTGLHIYTEPELIGFSEKELREFGFNDQEIGRYIYDRAD